MQCAMRKTMLTKTQKKNPKPMISGTLNRVEASYYSGDPSEVTAFLPLASATTMFRS